MWPCGRGARVLVEGRPDDGTGSPRPPQLAWRRLGWPDWPGRREAWPANDLLKRPRHIQRIVVIRSQSQAPWGRKPAGQSLQAGRLSQGGELTGETARGDAMLVVVIRRRSPEDSSGECLGRRRHEEDRRVGRRHRVRGRGRDARQCRPALADKRPGRQRSGEQPSGGWWLSGPAGPDRTRSRYLPRWALQLELLGVLDRCQAGHRGPRRHVEVLLREVLDVLRLPPRLVHDP